MRDLVKKRITDSIEVKNSLLKNDNLFYALETLVDEIVLALKNEHKIILCGNGGSASDALHFAGEIVGRFGKERPAWSAIVLNADVATMTSIGNDYGYDDVFARQAQGHCASGDVFIGISTSGNSKNVIRAINVASSKGCKTAALLGSNGGEIGKIVEYPLIVPCNNTARVQESHILLIHIICELVEKKMCND